MTTVWRNLVGPERAAKASDAEHFGFGLNRARKAEYVLVN
jgi:hypothetical protein